MGISGLLPMLKEISTPIHIKEWKGKTLAVDGYVWLHKGAYGCAEELARGKPTLKYVNYAMHRVRMLKHHGITPLMVFDGGLLPSKEHTETERERKRTTALARANSLSAEGKASQAREHFVKAVDVSPAMAYQLIKALRREGVQYIVAPYEADPQLAYLERHGIVDGIITEDSDLLIFGCRNVLFKLDNDGHCIEVRRDNFTRCREYNFNGWTDVEFRQMAILSGCDYLDSVPGMGLKTAFKLMRKYKTAEKVIQYVRLEGQLTVPQSYLADFTRAELTFRHQRVFDPVTQQLTHLEPIPAHLTQDDLPFIGAALEAEYAKGVASGEIDPITKRAVVDLVPDSAVAGPSTPAGSGSFYGSKAKKPVEVAQGKASIMSFFGKSPAASGTPGLKGSASALLATPIRTPIATKSKSEPPVKSKHFGASTDKGKGKAVEEDTPRAESVMVDLTLTDDEGEVDEAVEEARLEVVCKEEDSEEGLDVGRPNDAFDRLDSLVGHTLASRGAREFSIPSSVAHISSPPCSPHPPPRSPLKRSLKLHTDENDPSGFVHLQPTTEADNGGSSPLSSVTLTPDFGENGHDLEEEEEPTQVFSSPPASPVKPVVPRAPRVAAVVRQVRMSDLSSDPIDCSSDGVLPSEDEERDVLTPRAVLPRRRASDEPRTGQRRRSSAAEREAMIEAEAAEAGEEVIESRQAVAADWRTKFSLGKGGLGGIRASQSTPTLVRALSGGQGVVQSAPKATGQEQGMVATPTPGLRRSLTYNPAARVPLQPGLVGRAPPRQPFAPRVEGVNGVEPAALKKRKSVGTEGVPNGHGETEVSGSGSSEVEADEGDGSGREKVVVTNRRLLAFRYSGAGF